jgi:Zn-dependent alcohol dehydrogenase
MLNAAGESVAVEPIAFDDLGDDEILVRLAASGVCHTDLHVKITNGWGMAFPILLGHEGAGVVEHVGRAVTSVRPDDRVVISWRVPCGACAICRRGDPVLCQTQRVAQPHIRRARDGQHLARVLSTGTFATRTVVHEAQAIPVPDAIPLDRACLIACGVVTGVGAALNTAKIRRGSRVAVIGCGAVGLSVVQGARIAGADRIVAVDLTPQKLEWARQFGATDAVDARSGDPVAAARAAAGGPLDYAFEVVGLPATVAQAVGMVGYGGTVVIVGVPPTDSTVTLPLARGGLFNKKVTLTSCSGGDMVPSEFFPRLMRWYLDGTLRLDEMVTREIGLDDVEDAFAAMTSGTVIRSVIRL